MLTLTRKERETVHLLESGVVIHVSSITKDRVKLSIDAPDTVTIMRGELLEEGTHRPRSLAARLRKEGVARA